MEPTSLCTGCKRCRLKHVRNELLTRFIFHVDNLPRLNSCHWFISIWITNRHILLMSKLQSLTITCKNLNEKFKIYSQVNIAIKLLICQYISYFNRKRESFILIFIYYINNIWENFFEMSNLSHWHHYTFKNISSVIKLRSNIARGQKFLIEFISSFYKCKLMFVAV